ncbi:LOW QUALITY PROTEIN: elongin A, like [Notolabrus celidotus]|uniref:LOW QUALITY PROTEIN: elongin A, like n=1 Tax=Notolabrus celidotus TaxID=1203425 RepID=UPI001490400D|nr:LOW QUALITY PROTEIN: elongin A, like [Notolabrus celidotus]
MASSSDVVKKIMRFKLQLTDSAESATVVKILQKLKDLDVTLDILAETGIGKIVNALRRHEKAGEFAKSLVRGWKRLVPKESTSHTEGAEVSESLSAKDKLDQHRPKNGCLTEDLNNNCLTSHSKSHESSDEADFKRKSFRETDSEKQCEDQKTHNDTKGQKGNQSFSQTEFMGEKIEFQEDKMDDSVVSKKKKDKQSDRKSGCSDTLSGNKSSDDSNQKSGTCSKEKNQSRSENEIFKSEKESSKKSKTSDEKKNKSKESSSCNLNDKYSKTLQEANVRDYKSSEIYQDSQEKPKTKKRKEKRSSLKNEQESENTEHKNKKIKRKEKERDPEEPSMSFESCLNYDVSVRKRKEKSAVKKAPKKIRTAVKEYTEYTEMKMDESDTYADSPKPMFKDSIMALMNIPLPASLPECDKPSCVEYFERKVEREPDFCDEESATFTGQRCYKKMQVYSGNKAVSLPTMMSLHQQCIRVLQNNINLLYETGGVPFEILEPVLERCTPEQLLRIEECNPIYMGLTDHLWGRHCKRDFKDSKLQEYESWKEMYVRLSEERERKLQRLTKSIVSSHSGKPKGRQVKMAFIHTVAKPPRDVRIQQEIHGTAVQQPQQPRCSVKAQDNRVRASCEEPSRSSSSSSGGGNSQDPRKKSKVAPMMAKSLKAFKKQMGRR